MDVGHRGLGVGGRGGVVVGTEVLHDAVLRLQERPIGEEKIPERANG